MDAAPNLCELAQLIVAQDQSALSERFCVSKFVEGMLDRIFNQINKADVIVADMTGKNPNVFYEVGYAHALGKIVLLITQHADDIPFDLKHRQHTVYGGSIDKLKAELAGRISWAIAEAERRAEGINEESISIRIGGRDLLPDGDIKDAPEISGTVTAESFGLDLIVRNESDQPLTGISHVYLFGPADAVAVPAEMREVPSWGSLTFNNLNLYGMTEQIFPSRTTAVQPVEVDSFSAAQVDARDGLVKQYRLPLRFGSIPPGAIESGQITFILNGPLATSAYRLRIHGDDTFHDFHFKLNITRAQPPATPAKKAG
jgi:hypothetical protein